MGIEIAASGSFAPSLNKMFNSFLKGYVLAASETALCCITL